MYIILNRGEIIESDRLVGILFFFNCGISEKGVVTFEGIEDTVTYNMEEYTNMEALTDFANNRLITLLKRKGIIIYKGERL